MKTLKEVDTAKEVYAELESTGVIGKAAELVVKRTAHHRQARRARAAYEAAVAWARGLWGFDRDAVPGREAVADESHAAVLDELANVAASAWLACVLDASGIGGHMGLEGAKRERHPAFRCAAPKWGTGECWTAAIRKAGDRLESEAITAGMAGFHDGNRYRFLQVGLDGEGDLIVVTPDHTAPDVPGVARPHRIIMGGYGCPPDPAWRRAALACRLLDVLDGPAGGGLEMTSSRPDAERVPWCHCRQCSDPALIARALNDVQEEFEHARAVEAEEFGWMFWEQSNPGPEIELLYATREEAMAALEAYARRYCDAGSAAVQVDDDGSANCETAYDEGQIGESRAGIYRATKAEPVTFASGVPFHLTPMEPVSAPEARS